MSEEEYETVIVCSDCDFRRPTTEKYPTIAGECPKCGGVLEYEEVEE